MGRSCFWSLSPYLRHGTNLLYQQRGAHCVILRDERFTVTQIDFDGRSNCSMETLRIEHGMAAPLSLLDEHYFEANGQRPLRFDTDGYALARRSPE